MTDFDPSSFTPGTKGNQYEDFTEGQVLEHHWGRTINAGDNSLFSAAMLHFNPLYFNAAYAEALGHPRECVNPMLVLCTAVGMAVEDLSEAGGPFLGVNDCRFARPVYPGDTISSRSTVVSRRESASRPLEGIVTWETEVTNQRGEVVLTYSRTNLSSKRGGPRVNR
jgi:itaconyl-CoA hydratase